jgi:vacuolar-type H+-ATPase subunit I/STV1
MYFEVLWFGVGISINYRKAKQEKIGALQEVIQVKSNYNTQLEQEVKERTLQLENNLQTIAHLNNVLKENNIDLEHNIATLEQDRVLNKDMNLDEFKTRFDNAEKCMDLLIELKWKDGFVCNVCESKSFFLVNKASPYVKKCKECKKTHSATSDTLFHNLKFPLEKAFYILFLSASSKKYSVQQISDLIDLRVATVWSFRKKIEEKMESIKFHKKTNLTWQDLIL